MSGTYKSPAYGDVNFTVVSVEKNLCYAKYDHPSLPDVEPFIWRFKDGLNNLHFWDGK